MPSDILGAEVIEEDRATGKRVIRFIRGPIFANIILADEINRTPPKTQAALLEAMQEYQVTVNGVRFDARAAALRAGDAESDRAGGHLSAARSAARSLHVQRRDRYPTAEEERRILVADHRQRGPGDRASWRTGDEIERLHAVVREVPAADERDRLRDAAGAGDAAAPATARTRAGLRAAVGALGRRAAGRARRCCSAPRRARCSKAAASLRPRTSRAVALPVLRHRILLNFQAEADGIDADPSRPPPHRAPSLR